MISKRVDPTQILKCQKWTDHCLPVMKRYTKNIKDLLVIVSDGEVNYEEKYRKAVHRCEIVLKELIFQKNFNEKTLNQNQNSGSS